MACHELNKTEFYARFRLYYILNYQLFQTYKVANIGCQCGQVVKAP